MLSRQKEGMRKHSEEKREVEHQKTGMREEGRQLLWLTPDCGAEFPGCQGEKYRSGFTRFSGAILKRTLSWRVIQAVREKSLHQNCEMGFRHCGEEVGSGGGRFLLRRSWLQHREDSEMPQVWVQKWFWRIPSGVTWRPDFWNAFTK